MPLAFCVTGESRENGREQKLLKAGRSGIPSTLNWETLHARKTDSLQKKCKHFSMSFRYVD